MSKSIFYKTIDDLPAYLYFKIRDTGEVELLTNSTEVGKEELLSAWDTIEEEVIGVLITSPRFKRDIKTKIRKTISKGKAFIKDDKIAKFKLILEEKKEGEQEEEIANKTVPFDYFRNIAILERLQGPINEKKVSLRKYLTYKILAEDGKEG